MERVQQSHLARLINDALYLAEMACSDPVRATWRSIQEEADIAQLAILRLCEVRLNEALQELREDIHSLEESKRAVRGKS